MTAPLRPALVGVVPDVPPAKPIRLPTVDQRRLDNGLRLVAARRPGVPRVEARLLVPSARAGRAADRARAAVMAKTLLSGTAARTSMQIAQEQQRIGGHLDAHADSDDVVVSGSTLSTELPAFLDLLADVVTGATYPGHEVAVERDVLAEEITLSLSQPATVAREALLARLFADHPYGRGQPAPAAVRAVKAGQLRKLHDRRLRPEGAILVLVGDFTPARALDRAEAALAGWAGGGAEPGLAPPAWPAPGPTLLVDRPGAVQTNVRIGGPAVTRTHPDYPALALANLVFGGYFISRLVDNIRERRGYTYSPSSGIGQSRAAGYLSVQADVGTDVTGPALVEIRYELNRMLAGPLDEQELLAAKRYLAGSLSMSVQTQAGLCAYLSSLVSRDLPVEYLRDFPAAVQKLSEDEVIAAARRYMAPRNLHTVLVGDAASTRAAVEALDEVEVRPPG